MCCVWMAFYYDHANSMMNINFYCTNVIHLVDIEYMVLLWLVALFRHVILFIASKMQIEIAEPHILQLHRIHRQHQWKICQITVEYYIESIFRHVY